MCPGLSGDPTFCFDAAGKQRGLDTPWYWNLLVRTVLDICIPIWNCIGFGVVLPIMGNLHHLVWADNINLLAGGRADMQLMINDVTMAFARFGFEWKPSSLQVLDVA